jgi:glycosyltransferase involved in cell wall biosynthesis
MNKYPVFSIIIPAYNSELTLKQCLDSILYQSFKDFEILIMDGLSTDNTIKIAANYNDSRIKIHSEKDSGIYDAMNKGITISTGKWLYFLGSNDYLYDETVLQVVHDRIENKEIDVIYGNVLTPAYDGKFDGEFDYAKIFIQNICHQSIFFTRKLFDKTGLYNLKYKILADYDHNLKWFLNKKTKIEYIDQVIAYYNDEGCSTTSNQNDLFTIDRGYNYILYGFRSVPKRYLLISCRRELKNNLRGFKRKCVIALIVLFILFRI